MASFEDDCDIEVEDEDDEDERSLYASRCESSDDILAYANEPLADGEWLKKYEAESEQNKRLEQELQARLTEVSLEAGHRRIPQSVRQKFVSHPRLLCFDFHSNPCKR